MPTEAGKLVKVRMVTPLLTTLDTRTCKPPPKVADAALLTPEHKMWAQAVKGRAGWRCEETLASGARCPNRAPGHRMFADHIVERRDGGSRLDLENGRCLCGQHHGSKTIAERAKRMTV